MLIHDGEASPAGLKDILVELDKNAHLNTINMLDSAMILCGAEDHRRDWECKLLQESVLDMYQHIFSLNDGGNPRTLNEIEATLNIDRNQMIEVRGKSATWETWVDLVKRNERGDLAVENLASQKHEIENKRNGYLSQLSESNRKDINLRESDAGKFALQFWPYALICLLGAKVGRVDYWGKIPYIYKFGLAVLVFLVAVASIPSAASLMRRWLLD